MMPNSAEIPDIFSRLDSLSEAERLTRQIGASPDFAGSPSQVDELMEMIAKERVKLTSQLIPVRIYINLPEVFAGVAFTIPNLTVDIPESPSLEADNSGMVISIINNGKYTRSRTGYNGISPVDFDIKTEIEGVDVFGGHYTGFDLTHRRKELLNGFFVHILKDEKVVEELARGNTATGLGQDQYLYRAITRGDWSNLQSEGTICYSHLDPSANFENEKMYESDTSQVKFYAQKTDQGYTGQIIRWPIEHPLLYRVSGGGSLRVAPFFSHYLPLSIEVSDNQGKSFTPLIN